MRHSLKKLAAAGLTAVLAAPLSAQPPLAPVPPPPPPGPYAGPQTFDDFQRARRVQDFSLIYVEAPPPREIKVQDLVTILVNEKSLVTMNANFNRQRNATMKAELKEFIRLGQTGNLANAADNQPTIDGNLNGRIQSTGQMIDQEGMTYRIAATVVDVQPNGILVLEARKFFRSNREMWSYTLTGRVRSEDVNRDNTILSEDIADTHIVKKSEGKVYRSTERPWGTRLWDKLFPF